MMKKKAASIVLLLFLAASCLFAACGQTAPEPTAEPESTAAPTPAPTPEPIREAVLTGDSAEEILALMGEPLLEHVDARASTYYAELVQLHEAVPDAVIEYSVDFGGTEIKSTDTTAVLPADCEITPAELSEKLNWLPLLERIDIYDLDWPNEDSMFVQDEHPEKRVIFRLRTAVYDLRTDITVYSTLPREYEFTTEKLYPILTYCRDLVALDIGHQTAFKSIEPLRNLKKLKVLILADLNLENIDALAELTELEYLELFIENQVQDFSPLANCTKMKDINLCYCRYLTDLSFLDSMPDLENGWFSQGIEQIPKEEQERVIAEHPNCHFEFRNNRYSTGDGWRAVDRNVGIRKAFANWPKVVNFNAWNDVQFQEDVYIQETYPTYK